MISDRAIAEVAALEESRRREYRAERKRAAARTELADLIQREADPHLIDNYRANLEKAAEAILRDGYRPPARVIETQEELDALTFPCLIREEPTDSTDFYPQIWEMGFQTDWCRAGAMYDPDDCTPRLPVTVLIETEEWNR